MSYGKISSITQYLTQDYDYGTNKLTLRDIHVVIENRQTIADAVRVFYNALSGDLLDGETAEQLKTRLLEVRNGIGDTALKEVGFY